MWAQPFVIQGVAHDALSGVVNVYVATGGNPAASVLSGAGLTRTWTYTWPLPIEDSVTHTVTSVAVDAAGNPESPGPTIVITLDDIGPAVNVLSPSAGQVFSASTASVPIYGTSNDNSGVSALRIYTDATYWIPPLGLFSPNWTGVWQLSSEDGVTHILHVYAVDQLGNIRLSQNVTVTMDNVSPFSVVNSPADGSYASSPDALVFQGNAYDGYGIAQVDVSVDGGPYVSATGQSTWILTWTVPLTDGLHTIPITRD